MRRYRALAVSAVTAAVVGLAAPMAAAWDDDHDDPKAITVTPSVIAPGGQLRVTVDTPECRSVGGSISSPAFPSTQLRTDSSGRPSATVTVNQNASRGTYDITARCDGRTITRSAAFTVIGGVQGGLGGSSMGATATDIAIGAGLVAAAALGGGVVMMRRRAESRV